MKNIRPIELSDLERLNKWKNNREVYKYLGGGYVPTSIDEQKNWMDDLISMSSKARRFMIIDEKGLAVGMIGLYDINWINKTCEVGMFIGETKDRGKGIGSNAYLELEKYSNEYLNIRKFKINVVSNNEAAFLFWKKQKFEVVGRLIMERYIESTYCDVVIMEKFINEK